MRQRFRSYPPDGLKLVFGVRIRGFRNRSSAFFDQLRCLVNGEINWLDEHPRYLGKYGKSWQEGLAAFSDAMAVNSMGGLPGEKLVSPSTVGLIEFVVGSDLNAAVTFIGDWMEYSDDT